MPEPTSYFNGMGFALSEDETDGYLVRLHLIKNDNLEGKMSIDNENFRVSGRTGIEGKEIELTLSRVDNKAIYGKFSGEIDNFKTFSIIRGTLDFFDGRKSKVTLISERESVFNVIEQSGSNQPIETKLGEITVVEGKQTTNTEEAKQEIIIKATEVKDEKILWIFPTGNKILEAEITTSDGKTYQKSFKANSNNEVEGYKVAVGDLEDKSELKIEVSTR